MACNRVTPSMEQRVVMQFLINEGVKPVDIHRRLQAQFGDQTLSRSKTLEWCKSFQEVNTCVNNDNPGQRCSGEDDVSK